MFLATTPKHGNLGENRPSGYAHVEMNTPCRSSVQDIISYWQVRYGNWLLPGHSAKRSGQKNP